MRAPLKTPFGKLDFLIKYYYYYYLLLLLLLLLLLKFEEAFNTMSHKHVAQISLAVLDSC